MDFYSEIEQRGLGHLLKEVPYSFQKFYNSNKVYKILDQLKDDHYGKVLIYGDYDVDGLMFSLIAKDALDSMGIKNYMICPYTKRTHSLDKNAVRFCIQNHFNYFIIGDTGSSELDTLKMLEKYGIKLIVLDHHNTNYSYNDFGETAIINTILDNKIVGYNKFAYSGAALGYVVFDDYLASRGFKHLDNVEAYAVVSLYSDCMDMSNELNRALYYKARQIEQSNLPKYIKHFMNEFQSFNARFIGYWFAPRINASFRAENFTLLNKYFLADSIDAIEISHCVSAINDLYQNARSNVNVLTDLVDVEVLNYFVVSDLKTAEAKGLAGIYQMQNYTGLVANKLAERYGKSAIVYCEYNYEYKGSFRDLYGRNYLPVFQKIGFAQGHNSAFGLKIDLFSLDQYLDTLRHIDEKHFIAEINAPIIIDYNYALPDEGLIRDIALYNEFSGYKTPVCYLQKSLIGDMPERKTPYNYKYAWGEFYIQSDFPITFGTKMLVKPIISKNIKLLYQR